MDQFLDRGYDEDKLNDMRRLLSAKGSDLYDVLAYVLFTMPPITRETRAKAATTTGMDTFQGELRELLVSILQSYVDKGEGELGTRKLGQYLTARFGSVGEAKEKLGELAFIKDAYKRMQAALYSKH